MYASVLFSQLINSACVCIHVFDEIIFYVMDPLDVWMALMDHQIHFGVWERPDVMIDPPENNPFLVVYEAPIPATRYLTFNLVTLFSATDT